MDPLRAFPRLPFPALLEVHLLEAKRPSQGGGPSGPSLFVPTLGSQRMETVARLVREQWTKTLLDIGEHPGVVCGMGMGS